MLNNHQLVVIFLLKGPIRSILLSFSDGQEFQRYLKFLFVSTMTDEGKDSKDQQGQRQQKKHWKKNNQHRFENKKKDPEEIPILKYGPANNFSNSRQHYPTSH